MNKKMYDNLCLNTRLDPNAALVVNGNRYNVLIDTVGFKEPDPRSYAPRPELEVRCKVISSDRYCRTYAYSVNGAKITKVIFNYPATIVFWSDNTKTVVKCQDGEAFDPEKGLAIAITKKAFGNQGNYCNEFKKWTRIAPPTQKSAKDEAMEENRQLAYNRLRDALHNKKYTKVDLIHAMRDAAKYLEDTIELWIED
jgi:hypothetical protein